MSRAQGPFGESQEALTGARYAFVADTALDACQIGLFSWDGWALKSLFTRTEHMTRGHQEFIGPAVVECFQKSGMDAAELGVIGVTLGPGSFTGLRVGLSFAKGMATGLNVAMRGFSTLELMGWQAGLNGRRRLIAHDAGRGQVYVQMIEADDSVRAPKSFDLNDLSALRGCDAPDLLIGSGGRHLIDIFPKAELITQALPDLEAMARLCFMDTTAYDDLTPLYMRDADAKVSNKAVVHFAF